MVGQQEAKLSSNSQEMIGEKELAEMMLEACLNGLQRAWGLVTNVTSGNAQTQRENCPGSWLVEPLKLVLNHSSPTSKKNHPGFLDSELELKRVQHHHSQKTNILFL